jgi:hypothetical protein
MLHPPVAIVRKVLGEIRDDLEEAVQFLFLPTHEVVGREQVEGRVLDAEVVAPDEELAELRGAGTVAVRDSVERTLLRPAAVAVEDHRHMLRQFLMTEPAPDAILVQLVEDAAPDGHFPFLHGSTLAHAAGGRRCAQTGCAAPL